MATKSKANALIGQSGGCTAVINQSLVGAVDALKASKAVSGIWGMSHAIEGVMGKSLIDLRRLSAAELKQVANQPSSALGSSRYKLKPGQEYELIDNLKKWDVRYLFMAGGNDTADTINRVAKAAQERGHELNVVHIPKTIDNDLMETDHCPGYGSIARFAAVTTQEAALDTHAMQRVDRVKIIEHMGRNSGWIIAAASLLRKKETDAPHLLYMPEIPFSEKDFLKQTERTLTKVGYCVVVISETIRDASGKRIGVRTEGITHDPFGHQYVEGAAAHLARLVESHLKVRARFDKPGTIARMSIPYVSTVDQQEAYQAGCHAVKWALKGVSKVMVGFKREKAKRYNIKYVPVPVEKIPGRERYFPASFLNPAKTNVSEAFRRYALPLVGPDLPSYLYLKAGSV